MTPDLDTMRRLRDEGLSASQIAERLGCTKNAVVGQLYRHDLPEYRKARDAARKRDKRAETPPQPMPRYRPSRILMHAGRFE